MSTKHILRILMRFLSLLQLREAEERARKALAAMEARRQAQGQQFTDTLATAKSEELVRTEAIERALREQTQNLREVMEAGGRVNRERTDELHSEVKSLEDKLRTVIAGAQMEESGRLLNLLQGAQEQVKMCKHGQPVEYNSSKARVSLPRISKLVDIKDRCFPRATILIKPCVSVAAVVSSPAASTLSGVGSLETVHDDFCHALKWRTWRRTCAGCSVTPADATHMFRGYVLTRRGCVCRTCTVRRSIGIC